MISWTLDRGRRKYMMKNRKMKVYETEYQINNPDGFGYCRKKSVSIPQIQCERGKLVITKES